MPTGRFDIYRTATGITAVTHPVRRAILEALEQGDRQLPELVELTGKSKPTLSGSHMKELLNQELILELPHPTDSRRKVYRLNATRIGSSDLPVEQLRDAVRAYANPAPQGEGIPWAVALRALAHPDAPTRLVAAQAEALGRGAGPLPDRTDPRSWIQSVSRFLEVQGLWQTSVMDLETPALSGRPGDGLEGLDGTLQATLLAGLLTGVARRAGSDRTFLGTAKGSVIRLAPQ